MIHGRTSIPPHKVRRVRRLLKRHRMRRLRLGLDPIPLLKRHRMRQLRRAHLQQAVMVGRPGLEQIMKPGPRKTGLSTIESLQISFHLTAKSTIMMIGGIAYATTSLGPICMIERFWTWLKGVSKSLPSSTSRRQRFKPCQMSIGHGLRRTFGHSSASG